jgi:hypothetical protein
MSHRTRKQSLLGELIELRSTGKAGSTSALTASPGPRTRKQSLLRELTELRSTGKAVSTSALEESSTC